MTVARHPRQARSGKAYRYTYRPASGLGKPRPGSEVGDEEGEVAQAVEEHTIASAGSPMTQHVSLPGGGFGLLHLYAPDDVVYREYDSDGCLVRREDRTPAETAAHLHKYRVERPPTCPNPWPREPRRYSCEFSDEGGLLSESHYDYQSQLLWRRSRTMRRYVVPATLPVTHPGPTPIGESAIECEDSLERPGEASGDD